VYESPEWQEYMKTKSLRGDFLTGEPLAEYWIKGRDLHQQMLSDIGDI
jgi:tripartite-type tricarboxylate transporter receptor subunit TctC